MTLALAMSLLLGQHAPERQGSEPLTDPALEARVQTLGKELRCAVCQGVAISDSPASMAKAQLDKVRELVTAGQTDQQIKDYFVARYGEWILLEPTKDGLNSFLWMGPVGLLLIGLAIILLQKKQQPTSQPATASPDPTAAAAEPDDLIARVRADLEK